MRTGGSSGYFAIAVITMLSFQACQFPSTTATRRAEAIVKLLVSNRIDQEKLVTDMRTRNTLRYIAARISQDQVMRYTSKKKTALREDYFVIQVDVSERSPQARGRTAVYSVNVHFSQQQGEKPRVIKIEAPD